MLISNWIKILIRTESANLHQKTKNQTWWSPSSCIMQQSLGTKKRCVKERQELCHWTWMCYSAPQLDSSLIKQTHQKNALEYRLKLSKITETNGKCIWGLLFILSPSLTWYNWGGRFVIYCSLPPNGNQDAFVFALGELFSIFICSQWQIN